jgi:Protein of unknown function (DUF4058)
MPVHDWTRVPAGIFHHFHQQWMAAISNALNEGRLPPGYYALAEQIAGDIGPDVLTLEIEVPNGGDRSPNVLPDETPNGGAVSVAEPKARFKAETEMDWYASKQNTLVIHHSSGDEIVALIEIVSSGNKSSRHALRSFVDKAASALYRGYHLLILDIYPPGPRDPNGIHGAIWEEIADASFLLPPDKPLTLVSYSAGPKKRAFIEPTAVGDLLVDMPLFLQPGVHILVPLEATYGTAWNHLPQRWRQVLESPSSVGNA